MALGNLGTYEPTSQLEGDRLKASDMADSGHPMLVNIVAVRHGIKTRHSPDGGSAVIVDVLNMQSQEVFVNVLWMNGIIVENLSGSVGDTLAIRFVWKAGKSGNNYITIEPLDDAGNAVAQQWIDTRPTVFDDARREKEYPTAEQMRNGQEANKPNPVAGPAMTQSAAAPTPPPAPSATPAPAAPPAPPAPPAPSAAVAAPPAAPVAAPDAVPANAPADDDEVPF